MNSINKPIRQSARTCYQVAPQSGFSLIEMLVVVAISLLMMVAILQLFLDVTRTQDEMSKTNAQMENGRFAIQVIKDDVIHGGFWDGYIPQFDDLTAADVPTDYPLPYPADPTKPPEPCAAFTAWDQPYKTALLGTPVQVYDAVPPGCAGVVVSKKASTDVLVVRHADTTVTAVTDPNKVYFQTSSCIGTSPYVLPYTSSYAYVLSKSGFNDLKKMDCLTGADKRKYVSSIYFIRDDDTLMRAEFVGAGGVSTNPEWNVQPLIEGIEGLVVELGIDNVSDSGAAVDYTAPVNWADPLNKVSPINRGDGAPDGAYVHCTACTVAQLANTVAVKIHVLARNLESTRGYTDDKIYQLGSVAIDPVDKSFKRHVYSTTVRLNNVSMRRETP